LGTRQTTLRVRESQFPRERVQRVYFLPLGRRAKFRFKVLYFVLHLQSIHLVLHSSLT
jgi:hypothetical protein